MVFLDLFHGDCLEVMKDLSANSVDCFVCDLPYGCLQGGFAFGKGEERLRASGLLSVKKQMTTTVELHHGDCLEVMKDLSANSVDCFVCDLPYGCLASQTGKGAGYERPSWKGTDLFRMNRTEESCSWDIKINLEKFWEQVKRLRKNKNTPVLMFATTKFGYELIQSNPSWFRYDLVWDKGRGVSFLTANKMPMRSHEMIYVFSEAGAYYNRIDEERKCVKSVIPCKKVVTQGHPTEKPQELYKWLIERYCPEGGTILDPTAGSFNSCFAAYALNRNAIGIEKDDKFYKKACEKADAL